MAQTPPNAENRVDYSKNWYMTEEISVPFIGSGEGTSYGKTSIPRQIWSANGELRRLLRHDANPQVDRVGWNPEILMEWISAQTWTWKTLKDMYGLIFFMLYKLPGFAVDILDENIFLRADPVDVKARWMRTSHDSQMLLEKYRETM